MTDQLQRENRWKQGREESSGQLLLPRSNNRRWGLGIGGGSESEEKWTKPSYFNIHKWQLLENTMKGNKGRMTYWLLSNGVGDEIFH